MQIDAETVRIQLDGLATRPRDLDSQAEAQHIAALVAGELASALSGYSAPEIRGAGGSGIVISAVYDKFGLRRALKIPRKQVFDEASAGGPAVDVDPELDALSKVSHKNITRLYEAHPMCDNKLHCVITEYVENPAALDRFAHDHCCSELTRDNELRRAKALRHFASVIHDVIDALSYLHATARLIHFDIKPDNVLVSAAGKPFVTDLGFAREMGKYPPGRLVDVGFTYKYAHPSLTDTERGARVSSNPARAKNKIFSDDILPRIDLFAFGRTLQESLKRMEDVHGETIHSDYTFNYLHLVACLCLDGQNAANAHVPRKDFVSDQALEMPVELFSEQKFGTFGEVELASQRLLGQRRLEGELPELDRWASATINVSDLGITTVTPRVQALIEHPAVQRLASEYQLGLLDSVFPVANHTRFQHTLGVFHAVGQYLTALYYDPESPTFRALFRAKPCERALLAALVHDIGQSTFGHELEEVDREEFSHDEIGFLILERCVVPDRHGRTLRQLVEGEDPDEWAVALDDVLALLTGRSRGAFDRVLCDVMDGQLDADKLDYLIRDTVEARVKYGHGIDHERFIRSLTALAVLETEGPALRLAVKRKGAASAEAFALARYQLYQALYWHHTFRAIKAMFSPPRARY